MGQTVNQKAYSRIWRDYFLLQKDYKTLLKDKENLLKIIKDIQSIGEHAIEENGKLVTQYTQSGSWQVVNDEAVNFGICKGKVDAYTTINKFIVSELYEISGIKTEKGGLDIANDSELI